MVEQHGVLRPSSTTDMDPISQQLVMGAAGSGGGGGPLENMKPNFVVGGGYASTGPAFTAGTSFNATGTKMYGITYLNPTYTLREYTLSTPWDISYASETASKDLVGQHTGAPYFTADGLSMYITWRVDSVLPKIYQYSLSTAWDISTLTKVGEVIPSQATDGTALYPITFKPDGSVIYFGGSGYIYSAPLSAPWNITTLGAVTTLNATAYASTSKSITFSSDGTKLYIAGQRSATSAACLVIYTLSTAWNLSTATFTSVTNISTFTIPQVIVIVQGGTKLIYRGYTFNTAVGHTWMQGALTTPWDASTFTLTPNSGNRTSLTTTGSLINYYDLDFTSDGLGLFVWFRNSTTAYVISHTLSTPWDVSTRGAVTGTQTVNNKSGYAGLLLTPDKTKYLTTTDSAIYEWTMTTPGVASPATNTATYSTATGYTYNGSLCWNNNGTKLFVYSNGGTASTRRVLEFTLTTPYSISSMTFVGVRITLPSTPDTFQTYGLGFAQNGKLFYAGTANYLFKYNVATAWDLTTATFANTYKVDWWDYVGLAFKIGDNGKKTFFLSNGTDISTAGYPVNPKGALYGFTL